MWLPKTLYEMLPLLYAVISVLGVAASATAIAQFLGVLLLGITVKIVSMRIKYRVKAD